MNDALEARVKAIFQRVLEIDADARAPFLERVCEGDDTLRRRVDDMLSAYDEVGEFLAAPGEDDADGTAPDEGVGAIIDRYKLLQSVGEGGFGTVYMAEQSVPVRRMVALKIIKLGMDTKEVIARFEAERQALAMMDHPNIAKVLDAGATPNGRPYFVMELVRGVSITEYCDQAGVDTPLRLDLFRTVCDAIQHAHQKGVIHRDIKPSNVLVTLHDGVPVPKVIDFGVAKATDHRLTERTLFTELHQMVGTPEYMSPEQAELSGLDVDTRADVYSLGVLLYELLTGTKPFDLKTLLGEGFGAVLRHIREVDPPKPSSRVSTMQQERLITVARQRSSTPATLGKVISGDLDWIVMKALEKDRTRRYETANALAMDILRYQQDEPVLARSPRAGYRLRKYVRRHRVAVGAAAAVIVALVVGAVLALRGYVEADAQLGRALRAETVAQTEAKNAKEQRDLAIAAEQRADKKATEADGQREKAVAAHARADREAAEARRQREAAIEAQKQADAAAAEAREAKKQADAAAADAKLQRAESDRRFGIISRLMAAYHEELGDTPRERWSGIFLTGMQAALAEGDPEDVFFFLEQARMDPLLGLIESRDQLADAALPKALRTVENAARARVLKAQTDYARAVRGTRSLKRARAARKALDEANERLQVAILQTQRLARAVAATKPVLPVTLQELRSALRPNQAYVAFAVLPERVVAFVVTGKTARSVDLGPPTALNEAAQRLISLDSRSDPAEAIQELRSRLIDPLELEEEVTQVLVSPEGALLAVSFGLLLSDREVAYIPSATAYLSLLKRRGSAGNDVLAVGNPIYGKQAPMLSPLPATKREAMAIGSIVLLGNDATVDNVKAHLPKVEQWRALHFACHALENKKHPLLSAIAITASDERDGFLRAIDVVQLRFKADLVTLSACETARSEILQGGGIGSLPRAFLYAGASRMLVSQWKVDDAATVALMTKFYELWNPKDESKRMGAAESLKAAQAYMRNFEIGKGGKRTKPWEHPYYWAGWTIWGLVD